MSNDVLDQNVGWQLSSISDPSAPVISSAQTIGQLNEQILRNFGFSISIAQTEDVGSGTTQNNGAIGYAEEYLDSTAGAWIRGIPDGFDIGEIALDQSIFDYVATSPGELDSELDRDQALSNIGEGNFIPYFLGNWRDRTNPLDVYISPVWTDKSGGTIIRDQSTLADLNNVDIVFTSDKSKWSQCPIVEMNSRFYESQGFFGQGDRKNFDLRASPSVGKEDSDGNGLPDFDTSNKFSSEGFGWFPGYAIDVETGERLVVFFGENSSYDGTFFNNSFIDRPKGRDMMFNPGSQMIIDPAGFGDIGIYRYYAGGQHTVFVTKLPYNDESLEFLVRQLRPQPISLVKTPAIREITWSGFIMTQQDQEFLSYAEGLIPADVIVKLRVDNPYQVFQGTGQANGYPTYQFTIENKAATALDEIGITSSLDRIQAVPNPYYGFSDYETSQFTNIVKITNLPAKCTVTIYSLDGKFIRQYRRDETPTIPPGSNRGLLQDQITPALEWDLRNSQNIPIASGIYLIHVAAEELGEERTIKWFGVNRQFDPSGL